MGNERTEWFQVNLELRQGCVLSPILFAIFIDGLAKTIKDSKIGVRIEQLVLRILLFADDLVLIADDRNNCNSYWI